MDKKKLAAAAVNLLKKEYPGAVCSLNYEKPYELLISVRLSAQCTDARVNIVTPVLFSKYPTLESLAEASPSDIGEIIKSCGFFNTKSKDIVMLSQMLINEFDGVVPNNMEDLLRLPGVGRKTANLILGDVYHQPAVVCDTHCIRITNLLGLTTSKNPDKTEKELRESLPMDEANDFCHRLVLHGRAVCTARSPKCGKCVLNEICPGKKTVA